MQSGVYWGYVGLIEGLVTRITKEFGAPMRVIATGGLAAVFEHAGPLFERIEHAEHGRWTISAEQDPTDTTDRPDELVFLALGGVGEIGMNISLYGYHGRWLMIDCGITFADDTVPGIDVIMADPQFIADRADRLDGLVCTHAHEDHIGAVAYLWKRFRCPVYATPFTAAVLRAKLRKPGSSMRCRCMKCRCRGVSRSGSSSSS